MMENETKEDRYVTLSFIYYVVDGLDIVADHVIPSIPAELL